MLDLRLITPPTGPVIATDIARQHLRQDQTADDIMIDLYVAAAAQSVQDMTGRALLPQTWEYRLQPTGYGCAQLVTANRTQLPLAPLLSVESITVDGAVVLAADYTVHAPSGPTCGRGEIEFSHGWSSAWSYGYGTGSAVIRFTAGYETADHIPAPLKAAVLLALGSLYENREAEAEKSGASARMLAENPAFMRLIRPYQLIG
jgi:uncharacterized phiE125 gp8 family phage protein